jgi:BON domain-containing protein
MKNSEEGSVRRPESDRRKRPDDANVTDPVRGREPSDWDRGYGRPDYNQGYGPGYEPGYPGGREPLEFDRFRESTENTWPILPNVAGTESGKHSGRGPTYYVRPDDRIREDVCERLTHHPEIDASEIEVGVANGEVTLSGTAPDRSTKYAAEDLVYGISGVKEVYNRLRVERG